MKLSLIEKHLKDIQQSSYRAKFNLLKLAVNYI